MNRVRANQKTVMEQLVRRLHTGGSLVLLFLIALAAAAEPVVLPPIWTEAQRVQHLTASPFDGRAQVAGSHSLRAQTNVKPLLQDEGGYAGDYGYYRFSSLSELRINLARWRLSYAFGMADRFEGDEGGTQLYLYGVNLAQIPFGTLSVRAKLNRSAVNRWTLEHFVPVRRGWVLLGGSLYLSRRVQQGTLAGAWQGGEFDGQMVLDSTRGMDPAETRSVGTGMHLALSLSLSERWRFGFWGENLLGHLWQRKVRRVTAHVQANTIVPDADGFLHAAPFLSGRMDDLSRDLYLQRQVAVGLAYHTRGGAWLLFASHRDGWGWALGHALRHRWLLWHLPDGQVQAGWKTGQWQVVLGLSHLNPLQAKHATLEVQWSVPLGDR